MAKIRISFPDGSEKQYEKGITPIDIVKKDIGEGLARAAVAAKLDDETTDLDVPISKDSKLAVLTFKDDEGKNVFWHSSAHVLAQAVKRLYPDVKLTIGPAVEDGFYYDFDRDEPFTPEDLPKIEKEMEKVVKEDQEFQRSEIPVDDAIKIEKDLKEPYKVEMLEDLKAQGEKTVSMYKHGEFIDLCTGPHVPSTGKIKAFKLTKVAGAYWRGDASNRQLQRIYGVAFPDKKELKQHLARIKEAEARDHRKIGKEMDLFSMHDEAPGMPFFHSKGTFIWNTLVDFMREKMRERDYEENKTPIILNKSLWLQSGHWDHYKENMYFTNIDEQDFAVKPMNCPGNLLIYKTKAHSYRDLPIKAGEFGLVHRHELSGVLSGLFRVRVFTQDDAHVFCTEDQIEEQIIELIDLVDEVYKTFGFEYHVELSTKPEKAMGSQALWDKAESTLKKALDRKRMKYQINEGDGAFYGPKIDYHLKDTIGRTWQCGTIQLDFSMPEKFDLTYEGSDNRKHRPVMLHRAIYGSVERFLGILIEHYAGKFPAWLSPVQARILTVADRFNGYAEKLADDMKKQGLRVETDFRAESVPKKVREAQLSKVNYILVVGEKEQKAGTVNVRTRDNEVLGEKKTDDFVKDLLKEVEEKA
ncbi:threonine--tRNA ligase [Candidatus Woesearchaeota archaeon]|nr:threonine--tRNA ligase [Candidatus Woesearchaeota archaeon]